jgi:hypothetical protein
LLFGLFLTCSRCSLGVGWFEAEKEEEKAKEAAGARRNKQTQGRKDKVKLRRPSMP